MDKDMSFLLKLKQQFSSAFINATCHSKRLKDSLKHSNPNF